jgi:hypothetical protein
VPRIYELRVCNEHWPHESKFITEYVGVEIIVGGGTGSVSVSGSGSGFKGVPGFGSGSGSMRAKMAQKNRKKLRDFIF